MEQKKLMQKQEAELEMKMKRYAVEISQCEKSMKEAEEIALQYYVRLFEGHREALQATEKGNLAHEHIKELLPRPEF